MYANNRYHRQRGTSLVSLMVGILISLLVGITAMGSLQAFTVTQRQSAAVGTTLGTGVSALAVIKYELAQAGRGLFVEGAPLCGTVNLSVDGDVALNAQEMRPVDVQVDADGLLTLDIRYAQALESTTPVPLARALAGGTAELDGFLPVAAGQAVLLVPPPGPLGLCEIRTVTSVEPASAFAGQQLLFGGAGKHNQSLFATAAAFPAGSRAYLLGALEHVRIQQQDDRLVMARPLAAQEVTLATGVRAFSLQHGVANPVTGALADWVGPWVSDETGEDWGDLTAARTALLRALRMGLVLQSPQREKPDENGRCSTTPEADAPRLFDVAIDFQPDDTCFRYRTFTTVVPLRNLVLAQAGT